MKRVGFVLVLGVVLAMAGCRRPEAAPPRHGQPQVEVDSRLELMSIIFRLAGNEEYGDSRLQTYANEVDEWFGAVRDHPAVSYAAELRESRGIGWDAPMSLALHLDDVHSLKPRVPLTPKPDSLDGRWRADETEEFLRRAREFVGQSRFDEFWRAHEPLYQQASSRLEAALQGQLHLGWFETFFGTERQLSVHVSPHLLGANNSYGLHAQLPAGAELHSVSGQFEVDSEGLPDFGGDAVEAVVHAYCYHAVEPIVSRHENKLRQAAEILHRQLAHRQDSAAARSWKRLLVESLGGACAVRYWTDAKGDMLAQEQRAKYVGRGLSWMPALVDLLAQYESQREQYPSFEDFMPRVVEFFDAEARNTESREPQTRLISVMLGGVLMVLVALVAALGWRRRGQVRWRWLWAGAAVWTVGVAIKFAWALTVDPALIAWLWQRLTRAGYLAVGSVYYGLQSSLCEMGITLAAALVWRQLAHRGPRAVAVGVGSGAFEAALLGLVGLGAALFALSGQAGSEAITANLTTDPTAAMWLSGPTERILAIVCHISSRTLILLGVVERRWRLVGGGILLFAVLDGTAAGFHLAGLVGRISAWWILLAILPVALISVPITRWCLRRWPNGSSKNSLPAPG